MKETSGGNTLRYTVIVQCTKGVLPAALEPWGPEEGLALTKTGPQTGPGERACTQSRGASGGHAQHRQGHRDSQGSFPSTHLVTRFPCHPPQLVHGHGVETLAKDGSLHLDRAAIPSQHKGTFLFRRCHSGITQQKFATWWLGSWHDRTRVKTFPPLPPSFPPVSVPRLYAVSRTL